MGSGLDQPRVANAPLKSRLRHYVNLGRMRAKLARLCDDFAWDRIDNTLKVTSDVCVTA